MSSANGNKVALTGDVALELVAPYFREAGYEVYVPAGFGTWRQELLDPQSGLHRFEPDWVYDVTTNEKTLAEEVPGFYDERMRQLASMPYSLDGIRAIVEEFEFWRRRGEKKVLAVDADNTLWRGILSEDGRDALVPFEEFQAGLKKLRDQGVTLVLLSKNDPFEIDWFAVCKVNWAPKAGNLVEACRELNLGRDSVVFVDDNPHERLQMAAHLPEVTVAPFPADLMKPQQFLRRLREYFFSGMGATAEDRLRAQDYAARRNRPSVQAFANVGDYLKALELKVKPALATAADLDRLAQMAGKTNQFNATTIRRTRDEFAALLADATKRVFTFRTWDKFGEQGIVGYVVADLPTRRLTDFVMSCRAMGRTLEHFMYGYVSDALGGAPAVDFVRTAKNKPFEEFRAGLARPQKTYYVVAGQSVLRAERGW